MPRSTERNLTQMSFREICKRSGINKRQRIVLIKYFKDKLKGGEDQKTD